MFKKKKERKKKKKKKKKHSLLFQRDAKLPEVLVALFATEATNLISSQLTSS